MPHPFRPASLPQELIDEIDFHFSGLFRGQEPQTRCLWFDTETRRCRHYEFRPPICIEYELGGRSCLLRRREALRNGDAIMEPVHVDENSITKPDQS